MKKNKRNFFIVLAVVVLAVGLLGYRNFFSRGGESGKPSCIGPGPVNFHIHPQFKAVIAGETVPVPPNIGIEPLGCHRVLHTHNPEPDETDGFRKIHVESNFQKDFTLGDFFKVWEKPFSPTELLDCRGEVKMTVDDTPKDDYANLVLKDKQHIVLECGTVSE